MLYLSWPYIFALLNSVDPIYTPLSFEFLRPSKIILIILYIRMQLLPINQGLNQKSAIKNVCVHDKKCYPYLFNH